MAGEMGSHLTAFTTADEMTAVTLLFKLRSAGTPPHPNVHAQAAAQALADFFESKEGPVLDPCFVVRQITAAPRVTGHTYMRIEEHP